MTSSIDQTLHFLVTSYMCTELVIISEFDIFTKFRDAFMEHLQRVWCCQQRTLTPTPDNWDLNMCCNVEASHSTTHVSGL